MGIWITGVLGPRKTGILFGLMGGAGRFCPFCYLDGSFFWGSILYY